MNRPAIDPVLAAGLAAMPLTAHLDTELLALFRQYRQPVEPLLATRMVDRQEHTVTTADGTQLPLTIIRPAGLTGPAPCIYWLHGGGMVMGDRFANVDIPLDWLDRFGAIVVTLDYRLAPEVNGMTLVEDCYAGLVWTAAHATELGIDPARLVIAGTSAGGGLAAGTALLARDRNGPALAAQVLVCPMLDHRNASLSARQFSGDAGLWTQEKNAFGWAAVLGDTSAEVVPAYVSPSRAASLAGLPPTFIDVGSAEVFRDEDVDYANRIWAEGGDAELHVWPGGVHGFDALFPDAPLSIVARRTRSDWLARRLG